MMKFHYGIRSQPLAGSESEGIAMRTLLQFVLTLSLLQSASFGQSFTFEADTRSGAGQPGDLIVLDARIINRTQDPLSLKVIRVQSELPPGWSTSLCSGELCYPPDRDDYTIPDNLSGIPPLAAGDTAAFHLNFNTDFTTPGQAAATIRVENLNDSTEASELAFSASTMPSAIAESDVASNRSFQLHGNYPNPLSAAGSARSAVTTIPFEIGGSRSLDVALRIYNILGQQIAVLLDRRLAPGRYEISWPARDQTGRPVPAGVYFYELRAGGLRRLGKMVVSP